MDEVSVGRDLDRVESYLNMEKDTLNRLNTDWAHWDDTFQYIAGMNAGYVQSNLTESTFINNELNRMVFLDSDNQIVMDRDYESRVESIVNEEDIFELVENEEAYLIWTTPVFSIVSVRDILPSDGGGESNGKLLMFREINEAMISQVGKELATEVSFDNREASLLSGTRQFTLLDDQLIKGYSFINDDLNNQKLALAVERPRDFYIQEKTVISRLFYLLMGSLVLITVVLSMIFNRLIVSRVAMISKQLKEIQESKDVSSRVTWTIHNNDEIHALGSSVNEMLAAIEDSQHEMVNMAYYDQLTGLLNRYGIYEAFNRVVSIKDREIAFLFFDLDGFKRVNDSLGHQTGDDLLQRVTSRMKKFILSEDELLGRMGGDEFIMLLPFSNQKELRQRIHEILVSLKKDYSLQSVKTFMTTSVGVSVYPADGSSFDEVLQHADITMYEAKRKGKNQFVFYSDLEGDIEYKNILNLENDLKYALKKEELYLDYQPVYSPDGLQMIGVEGLLRWNHPTKGLIPPNVFIPIAEYGNFICDMGEWVLEQSIKQVVQWREEGLGSISIAINVSKQQMKQKDRFIRKMDEWLKEYHLAPSDLQIEITESDIFYYDKEIRDFAHELIERGVRVALDDFGVGTSTLFNLKQLPVNVVKIDRSFVRNVPDEPFDSQLLSGIYRVLDDLGFEVITEGVETEEQAQFVRANSHSKLQGYYYSRPIKPSQVGILLQEQIAFLEAASDGRKD